MIEPLAPKVPPEKPTPATRSPQRFSRAFWAVLFLLGIGSGAVVFIENAHPHRPRPPRVCIDNLKQIQAAVQQWALEYHQAATNAPVLSEVAKYIPTGRLQRCPAGGHYSLPATVSGDPTCSVGTAGHSL
jgi:hypothetical protein